jgi:acyl-CoA hydrolase
MIIRKKEVKKFTTYRLVKSEDLNHHGTLYAGRGAEWFVESGFIAASSIVDPRNIICLKIHGMCFSKSVKLGETICYNSKIVYCGTTSLTAYISVGSIEEPDVPLVDGFATFVHVNKETKPTPHGLEMIAVTPEDCELQQKAKALKKS